MKSIWKFEVPVKDKFKISMPKGTQIISFQSQDREAYIWGIVETDVEFVVRTFVIRGTGHIFKGDPGTYIGTIQMYDGMLVWHLFEIKE